MRKTLFVFAFYISGLLVAQNNWAEVNYTFKIKNDRVLTLDYSLLHDLKSNQSTYLFKEAVSGTDSVQIKNQDKFGSSTTNTLVYKETKETPEFQKYFEKDSLYSFSSIYGEKSYYVMTEKLPTFDWEIGNETKEILGYQVQKATTHFRGRDYEAWFAPEIGISNGPYKFHGLPGLILDIHSKDGKYEFTAYGLKLNQKLENFQIEHLLQKQKKSKKVSMKEMLVIQQKNIDNEIKYLSSKDPNALGATIEITGIELDFSDVLD